MASFVTDPITRVLRTSNSNWYQVTPWSPWMATIEVKRLQALIEVESHTAGLTIKPAVQLAETSTADPDEWVGFGTNITADGLYLEDLVDITTIITSGYYTHAWVRFGLVGRANGSWKSAEVTASFAGSSK